MRPYITADFLNYGGPTRSFDWLLHSSINKKAPLRFEFSAEGVSIGCDDDAEPNSALSIEVHDDALAAGPAATSIGALLLLPFHVGVRALTFSQEAIVSMRCYERSIADFAARNLAFALMQPEAVSFTKAPSGAQQSELRVRSEFLKRYRWVLHSVFEEPALNGSTSNVHVLIDAYVPMLSFQHPVLTEGAGALRRAVCGSEIIASSDDVADHAMEVRKRVLAHC